MIEVADIVRLHGPAYQAAHPLLPSQRKAMGDLVRCRTPALGGQCWRCDRDQCRYEHYSYHSCGNRHCPKCHGQQTQRWLDQHQQRLLPCGYFLLTFTLPQELRPLVCSHQKDLYGLLLRCAAAALQKLAWDPQFVGGQLAILAVLHTWTRALLYHPHVHLLVSAGGLSADAKSWCPPKNPAFLVPAFALSKIFRGKFRAGLKGLGYLGQVPPAAWKAKWVVHCQHAGCGDKVLQYLGRYVFRIAISNSRLERFENGQVTFVYRDNRTQELKHPQLSADEFIRRFLQHILPKGFAKVRSYGLWAANSSHKLQQARRCLALDSSPPTVALHLSPRPPLPVPPAICPRCKTGHLLLVASLLPQRTRAP
jgi:hypothetical protein